MWFQLHGVNEYGKTVIKKQIRRDQMAEFFVNLPACLIGMEACGSAHLWARKLQGFGHTVKLMAPQFVKPYVKTNKNAASPGGQYWIGVNTVSADYFSNRLDQMIDLSHSIAVRPNRKNWQEIKGSTCYKTQLNSTQCVLLK